MIEEPPFSHSRSRIHDQKLSSPSKFTNGKNGSKSRTNASPESNISSSNSVDLEFIEKIDLSKLSSFLKKRNLNNEEESSDHIQIHEKEKIKKIIHNFLKMKSFPTSNATLITKLLQILQIILRSLSDTIFPENKSTTSTPNSQDVKMVIGIQCPVCQKLFKSSYFIDKHIANKHPRHNFFWQNLKLPVPYFDPQNLPSKQNEEIERVLKKIHKDLRKERRNSSVSIESRLDDVESTMQNLGIISQKPADDSSIQHSRRHSSNSINFISLHQDKPKRRKTNESDYDSSYENDQNSKNHSIRRKINSNSKNEEIEYDNQTPRSARVQPSASVHQPQVDPQTPNSARMPASPSVPQPQLNQEQKSSKIQSSHSVPSTPSKIPKIPGKPFIPNLQLQTLKSQGQLPQPQLQLVPQSEPKLKPQKPPQIAINITDKIVVDENDENVSPEPRKTPTSSRSSTMRRPLPRRKPASLNVPSVQLDPENKTAVGQFYSPRKPPQNDDQDDLNFTSNYQAPMSARPDSHPTNVFAPKKPMPSTPHNKRAIPFPSPKKPQSETPSVKPFTTSSTGVTPKNTNFPVSPFTMIQVQSEEDEEKEKEKNNDMNDNDSDEQSDEICIQISKPQKVEKNEVVETIKIDSKNDDEKKNFKPSSLPVSVGISKRTHIIDNEIKNKAKIDDDDISEEYFDSVSSVSSESSELPEIDFKPKPKMSTNSNESKNNTDSRRKKRRRNDSSKS